VLKDSKNIAKVIIEKDNKFLILMRADNGKLDLPGGHCHIGESFVVGACREVMEETGLSCFGLEEAVRYEKKMIFSCKSFAGDIKLDLSENTSFFWHDKNNADSIHSNACTDVLVAAIAHCMILK
jgi:8-oxo-dGTP pyrophosphatase MutT (NUDIX family)